MRIKLVRIEDIHEGTPLEVTPPNMPSLAVYRIGEGFFVTDNQCTHGSAMLCDGFQEGNTIICPFHEGGFDIKTGKPTIAPCVMPIQTYKTFIEDDHVCIEV